MRKLNSLVLEKPKNNLASNLPTKGKDGEYRRRFDDLAPLLQIEFFAD